MAYLVFLWNLTRNVGDPLRKILERSGHGIVRAFLPRRFVHDFNKNERKVRNHLKSIRPRCRGKNRACSATGPRKGVGVKSDH
jgi:hypothetical protein